MPRKGQTEQLPKDVRVVKFAKGEFRPLFVAGKDIERVVIGYSAKAAANDRSRKIGPRYFVKSNRPYYRISDLEEYFSACPVETTCNV